MLAPANDTSPTRSRSSLAREKAPITSNARASRDG